jgi:WD40 repeat protein
MTFRGHLRGVHAVAFSPDDSKIASGSADGTTKIWDVSTGAALITCCHNGGGNVMAVAFSHKGDRVATGSYDNNIRILDCKTGKEVMPPLCLHHGPILALAFFPDDKAIISGSRDTQIRIWSLVNLHRQVSVQPRHTAEIQCIALSHNQKCFASGSRDTTIIVWNTSDGSAVFSPLKVHKAEIVALEISPDDKILVSASTDGSIYFWDLETGQMNGAPLKHSEEVISIKLSPDGLRLASITNSTLTVWGVSNRDYLLGPLVYPGHEYRAIAFSNDGAHMAMLCSYLSERQMDNVLGLEITIREAMKGGIVLTKQIDIQGGNIYWPTMQYAIEDKYFVLRYAVDQAIVSRAFDAATGQDYKNGSEPPHIPEFCRLAAMGSQILADGPILQLPEDFGHMGTIMCWESTKDMIVIGTAAGDAYCISLKK